MILVKDLRFDLKSFFLWIRFDADFPPGFIAFLYTGNVRENTTTYCNQLLMSSTALEYSLICCFELVKKGRETSKVDESKPFLTSRTKTTKTTCFQLKTCPKHPMFDLEKLHKLFISKSTKHILNNNNNNPGWINWPERASHDDEEQVSGASAMILEQTPQAIAIGTKQNKQEYRKDQEMNRCLIPILFGAWRRIVLKFKLLFKWNQRTNDAC